MKFSSLRFSQILLLLLLISAGLSTFIIQGESFDFYSSEMGVWGRILYRIGFTEFFHSWIFILLLSLLFFNMLLCTFKRVIREFKGIIKWRPGPDIIHIGVLLLIIGGIINTLWALEATVFMARGESITIDRYRVTLEELEHKKYSSGETKDWLSTLVVSHDGEIIKEQVVEVNRPLRFGGYSIFQAEYIKKDSIELSGLLIREEPGYSLILVALFIVLIGLIVTYRRKLMEVSK